MPIDRREKKGLHWQNPKQTERMWLAESPGKGETGGHLIMETDPSQEGSSEQMTRQW